MEKRFQPAAAINPSSFLQLPRDEYMYASIFINTTSKKTIQVGMQDFVGQYSVDWGLLMSAVVISLIPILIFFALVQKNLVQGLSAGAVKG